MENCGPPGKGTSQTFKGDAKTKTSEEKQIARKNVRNHRFITATKNMKGPAGAREKKMDERGFQRKKRRGGEAKKTQGPTEKKGGSVQATQTTQKLPKGGGQIKKKTNPCSIGGKVQDQNVKL